MIGSKVPIPDNILAHIRQCAATEHPGGHMAPQWQLALDHRRWLLAEVDRLRAELKEVTTMGDERDREEWERDRDRRRRENPQGEPPPRTTN